MARTSSAKDISRLLTLVAAVVVITALYFARVMLVPLALAVLFTFVLAPLVTVLERIRFPRFLAIFLVVGIAVSGIGVMGWTVGNQLIDVTNQLPSYKTNIKEKIDAIRNPKNRRLDKAADAMKELGKEIADNPPVPSEVAPSSLKNPGSGKAATQQQPKTVPVQIFQPVSNPLESLNSVITPLGSAIIVVVLTIFMLAGREDLRNRLIGLVGHGHLNVMTQALDDAGSRVSRYLVLQLVINACFGVVIGLGLYFIGIPNSMLWGVVAGLLRFLPYVGSPLAAVLPILLSLAIFPTWTGPVATIGLYLIVEILVANFLEPLIYGAHTGISSFAILFAAIFWTLIWGPIGLLLSTPLTVCLVVLGRHVPALQFLNIMLGDQPVLSPEAHYYQRLLASDQAEAKDVLENYLKTNSLEDLYDSVLIPALALAEQDRHHDDLEEITEQFICKSTKELLEELGEKSKEPAEAEMQKAQSDLTELSAPKIRVAPPSLATNVVCMPARDEADEIVGIMLSQLLERAGYHGQAIPIGTTAEMLAQVNEAAPDIVCISALPPFALLHARDLYKRVHSNVPNAKIIVGLWKFSGDPIKAAARFNIVGDDKLAITLAQAVLQVGVFQQIELAPEHASAGASESK
ncbi:MAG TPA: AI-2E family transporter [Verrucomicrobiae bacterium]|nr:AI-2E family transporter [Verrucomicrobiae bacterium]